GVGDQLDAVDRGVLARDREPVITGGERRGDSERVRGPRAADGAGDAGAGGLAVDGNGDAFVRVRADRDRAGAAGPRCGQRPALAAWLAADLLPDRGRIAPRPLVVERVEIDPLAAHRDDQPLVVQVEPD